MEQETKKQMSKKGQGLMGGILTGFVVVGAVMFLIILLVMTFGIVGTSLETTKVSNTVTNESGNITIVNGMFLSASYTTGSPRDYVIVTAINGSSGAIIPSTNYTVSTVGLFRNSSTNLAHVWANVNITYTFNNDSSSIASAKSAQNQVDNAIPFMGIMFIVLAVGAIITVLIFSLLGRRRA